MHASGHSATRTLGVGLSLFLLVMLTAMDVRACPWERSKSLLGYWTPPPGDDAARAALDVRLRRGTAARSGPRGVVPVRGNLGSVGRWSPPRDWPVIAIHAALMADGRVVHYSYPYHNDGSDAVIWDPVADTFTDIDISQDIFCSGLSHLADGRLLTTGGNDYQCEFQGRRDVYTFDPFVETWTRQNSMRVGRWYPNNVTLDDGSVMITSGLGRNCETMAMMELFTPDGQISTVPQGQRYTALYPRMHLLPDGGVSHTGPEADTYVFDRDAPEWQYVATTIGGYRWNGSVVPIPGNPSEILSCGGEDGVVTNTCERIDFADPTPAWRTTGSMFFARGHGDLLLLPDATVLMIGGGTDGLYGDPVFNAERYDPMTETWRLLPPYSLARMYHSTTILLPDGRVLIAGQDDGESSFKAEIYEPPYLFRGRRPVVDDAPGAVAYGSTFTVTSRRARRVDAVRLVGLSAVTHSINNQQRLIELDFSVNGANELMVAAPVDGNLAPPGYYMLFVLNRRAVPSIAKMIQITP